MATSFSSSVFFEAVKVFIAHSNSKHFDLCTTPLAPCPNTAKSSSVLSTCAFQKKGASLPEHLSHWFAKGAAATDVLPGQHGSHAGNLICILSSLLPALPHPKQLSSPEHYLSGTNWVHAKPQQVQSAALTWNSGVPKCTTANCGEWEWMLHHCLVARLPFSRSSHHCSTPAQGC